jgi:diguanylate cyclase (GGDEF)-like protein
MTTKPILILDDDISFRLLVAGLFKARGYQVFEARSAKEASSAFSEVDPCLAIVDYRLPESDGISWITWLRESGRNFPVVFCSGSWCDEKTFSWLRNILKVSLILRKPIVPELFLQQVEPLLPAPPVPQRRVKDSQRNDQFIAPITTDDLINQIERIDEAIKKATPDSSMLDQLVAMRSKLVVQQMLAEAKQSYAQELPMQWRSLSEAIASAQADSENRVAFDDGIQFAHRMRGTAGAMNFNTVGDAAGKIEDLLRNFDPSDTLSEVIWTEIFRALADGELGVRELAALTPGTATKPPSFESSILLFGRSENFAQQIEELGKAKIEAIVCESVASAIANAERLKLDAALFDLSLASDDEVFHLATQVRTKQLGKAIGFSLISSGTNSVNESSLVYAGCSSFLSSSVPVSGIVAEVQNLISIRGNNKPKVLTVDDDDALTRFIQTILVGEGIIVKTLNEPIQILNVVEQFEPDLVLLDVMMPGLSGYDVCRLLRATDKFARLPILFLTSKSDADGRAAAFQAGATDFLSKPILSPELVSRVRAHLGQNRGPADKVDDGLITRKEYMEAARSLVDAATKNNNEVAVCLIRIDDLLNISIEHGLNGADAVEGALAELIRVHFKADALRARWVDGAFALAVPGENKATIAAALQKLLSEFGSIVFTNDQSAEFRTSFCAGVSGIPDDNTTIENLMNLANVRMSRGKQAGFGNILKV